MLLTMRFTSTFRMLLSVGSQVRVGFQSSRSVLSGQSFQADTGRGTTIIEGQRIKLPKIGWVRMFQKLRHLGTIVKVVISKTAHRWFASIIVDTFDNDTIVATRHLPVVGVDVGINHLAVTSEGVYHENPKALKRHQRKLKRLQRQLS